MKGSCSNSFRSLKKFLYLNLDWGDSNFKSWIGRICYIYNFGTGVYVTFDYLKISSFADYSNINGESLLAKFFEATLGL